MSQQKLACMVGNTSAFIVLSSLTYHHVRNHDQATGLKLEPASLIREIR